MSSRSSWSSTRSTGLSADEREARLTTATRERCSSPRRRVRVSTSCGRTSPTLFAERFDDVRLLVPYTEGAALSALYGLGAPIEEREDVDEGVLDPREAPAPRRTSIRRLPRLGLGRRERARPVTHALVRAPAAGRHPHRRGRTTVTQGWIWRRATVSSIAPGERAVVGTGIAVADPPGHAALVLPRSGLAAKHGLSIVNAPGLIDAGLPRRAEGDSPQHRSPRRPSSSSPECGSRSSFSSSSLSSRSRRSSELPASDRGSHGLGSSGS